MNTSADSAYYVLDPDSLQVRISTQQRRVMYQRFMEQLKVAPQATILDVGVTSDRTFENSNYLEAWHPCPASITALGIDDASFLQTLYKGLHFVRGSGLNLPFAAKSFDFVHCSAVIEHIGDEKNQLQLVRECARVAKNGFFITTPNRWFPIEVHTSLPFLHWLPKRWHRWLLSSLGYDFYSREENLNLLSGADFRKFAVGLTSHDISILKIKLWGFASNLVLVGLR